MEANSDGDTEDEKTILVRILKNIASNLDSIFQQARTDVNDNINNFVTKTISKLFPLVAIYSAAFEDLNVATKQGLEQKVGMFFRHQEVQDAFDEVLHGEKNINELLCHVDEITSSSGITLKKGDLGPVDVPIINARSGRQEHLKNYVSESHSLSEVREAGGKILLVSFGGQEGACRWIDDTECVFDMVLDQERDIYKLFGLYRSVSKVWGIPSLIYYAEQKRAGRQLPRPYENVQDDPIQMGGDFILDGRGVVKMFYPSKISIDRPSVDQILSVLRSQD